ncbi:TPA: glycosyltransferase family 2 protein [Vibrio cholerae]
MSKAIISIITPNFNGALYIAQTIESVLAQTFKDWEMIIVDDCSTDSSIGIIERYEKLDDRIKLIKLNVNSGAAVARNIAIENSRGRYISFLDGDDIWLPSKLEVQLNSMKEKNIPFSFMSYYKMIDMVKHWGS